jgi:hypothetical protein
MVNVIAAAPGFVRLVYYDANAVEVLPVIAWMIDDEGAWPVVPGDDASKDDCTVEFPDGRVLVPYLQMYENRQEWLEAQVREEQLQKPNRKWKTARSNNSSAPSSAAGSTHS